LWGGYWNQGKYVPSLIAEIGNIIEMHLIEIGMINKPELDQHQQAFIDAKKAELSGNSVSNEQEQTDSNFPPLKMAAKPALTVVTQSAVNDLILYAVA